MKETAEWYEGLEISVADDWLSGTMVNYGIYRSLCKNIWPLCCEKLCNDILYNILIIFHNSIGENGRKQKNRNNFCFKSEKCLGVYMKACGFKQTQRDKNENSVIVYSILLSF